MTSFRTSTDTWAASTGVPRWRSTTDTWIPPPVPPTPAMVASVAVANSDTVQTSLVVGAPSGIDTGDLLIAQINSGAVGSTTPPNGWTQIDWSRTGTNAADANQRVYSRIAEAADEVAANYTWTIDSARRWAGAIYRITGHLASSPIDAVAGTGVVSTDEVASADAPAATTARAGTLVLVLTGASNMVDITTNYTFTAEDGWTEVMDSNMDAAGDSRFAVHGMSKEQAATGSTGTPTVTPSVPVVMSIATVAVAPAVS
jgi:hypothetical protein